MEEDPEIDELTYEPAVDHEFDRAIRIVLERLRRPQPPATIR